MKNIQLKDNLLDHYDYEAIPKKMYHYLKLWYEVDQEIVRFLKEDPAQMQGSNLYVELYPEKAMEN